MKELINHLETRLSDMLDVQDNKMQGPEEHEARNEHINDLAYTLEVLNAFIIRESYNEAVEV